jgi:hypothetical protein
VVRVGLHAHTRYSDGAGEPPELIAAALAAGLHVLVLADHDTLQPLRDGWEGYHDGLLVLVATEVRTEYGYALVLGLPADFPLRPGGRISLDTLAAAGGTIFAALPAHPGSSWDECRHPALAGLEVMNLHSLARGAASLPALPRFLWLLAGGRGERALSMLAHRPDGELALWDRMGSERPTAGLAAADAHGQVRIGARTWRVPSYEDCFRCVQTHLVLHAPLCGRLGPDRAAVLAALARGQARLLYATRGSGRGFSFSYHAARQPPLTEGERGVARERGVFLARSPHRDTLFRLYRDGELVGEGEGSPGRGKHRAVSALFAGEEPGTYRLEADRYRRAIGKLRLGRRPWMYTNPIYLLAEG